MQAPNGKFYPTDPRTAKEIQAAQMRAMQQMVNEQYKLAVPAVCLEMPKSVLAALQASVRPGVNVGVMPAPKCECGSAAVGSPRHSDWRPCAKAGGVA